MIMVWAEHGEQMAAGQFDDTVQVLGDVKAAGVRCYALSNMEPDAYRVRRARFPFMDWFDAYVISGLEGVAKPDRRIFEILLHRHGLRPQACVFIDDQARNVAAARELGLVGLHFSSAERLRQDLRGLGLPVA
jgi:2-haloacid dehalogenase